MKSHYLLGPLLWISSLQYFAVQVLVAATWTHPYSLTGNYISDLGNTILSPLHSLMNASFVLLGVTMSIGALLIMRQLQVRKLVLVGFAFLLLSGIGTVMVGLFPENVLRPVHTLGASLPFIYGNLALILIGVGERRLPGWLRTYGLIFGSLALVALIFYLLHNYLGIGLGSLERVVAYPQTVWLILMGLHLAKKETFLTTQ